ncbi:AVID protein, partial [Bucco capensis]|nr:AVID protein [Bucco capensis]
MVQTTPFLLVLSLALVAPGLSARKSVLTGCWTNDLGSNMTIGNVDESGNFAGSYLTAVKNTPNKIQESPLRGSQNYMNENNEPTFGFTVNWSFSDSITVFTGQYFVDDNGREILKTLWLLRSSVRNIKEDWKATMVGTNTFQRLHSNK